MQVKGTDPVTLKLTYYRADQNGFLVEKYLDSEDRWLSYLDAGVFAKPGDLTEALGEVEKQEIATMIVASGLFKPKTEYIIIGDEPSGGSGVVDLKSMLTTAEYEKLKKLLIMMPRQIFRAWFDKTVVPTLPGLAMGWGIDPIYGVNIMKKPSDDMTWAAFIDLFNQANLEYVNKEQIDPWDWEQEKYQSYLISQDQPALTAIENDLKAYENVDLALDPKAKAIMEDYLTLAKIGDPGLEINRQNSVKELLKRKEYVLAQAIVDAFRYASQTDIGEILTQPIPFDVVAGDGQIVKATRS